MITASSWRTLNHPLISFPGALQQGARLKHVFHSSSNPIPSSSSAAAHGLSRQWSRPGVCHNSGRDSILTSEVSSQGASIPSGLHSLWNTQQYRAYHSTQSGRSISNGRKRLPGGSPRTTKPNFANTNPALNTTWGSSVPGQRVPSNPGGFPASRTKPLASSNVVGGTGVSRHEAHEGNLALNVPFNPPGGGDRGGGGGGSGQFTGNPIADAALTTLIGLAFVFVGGIIYVKWYKKRVLDKIELAFARGYDPALELATHQNKVDAEQKAAERAAREQAGEEELDELDLEAQPAWTTNLRRKEQDVIDRIMHGQEAGHYFVLLGPKGAGKTTMIFESMNAVQAEGVAMLDAHPDLEVFRMRLGVALNYEFNEDTQTGLFQRRDPREAGPQLDIERALNKLEKVALRLAARNARPLVLVLNNIHFFNNDEAGRNMLLQLQQRAEAWAASGILTMVFASDDFWPYNLMRQRGSRMLTVSISDLDRKEAIHASGHMRKRSKYADKPVDEEEFSEIVDIVGGRLSFLGKVTKARDMRFLAEHLGNVEKANLLSKIGLIEDCDDDVMDEQKWSSCSWLLLQEFVNMRLEQEKERAEGIASGTLSEEEANAPLQMPAIPYWKCRQLMTRADFLEELDRLNIITIDVHHDVRPDSMLILHAARHVVEEDGFQEKLDSVRNRIDAIESLHRTRELTFKDLNLGDRVSLMVDKDGQQHWL